MNIDFHAEGRGGAEYSNSIFKLRFIRGSANATPIIKLASVSEPSETSEFSHYISASLRKKQPLNFPVRIYVFYLPGHVYVFYFRGVSMFFILAHRDLKTTGTTCKNNLKRCAGVLARAPDMLFQIVISFLGKGKRCIAQMRGRRQPT